MHVVGDVAGLCFGYGEDGDLHVAAYGAAVDEEGDIAGGDDSWGCSSDAVASDEAQRFIERLRGCGIV